MFRYPGGKKKLKAYITKIIHRYYIVHECDDREYVEPFVGSFAVGLGLLKYAPFRYIDINDIDYGISAFWNTVIGHPKYLIRRIEEFTPSLKAFYEFKEQLTDKDLASFAFFSDCRSFEVGFQKLAIHQMSYSGLGTMAGGPIGGVSQKSDYKIDCRWNPRRLKKQVLKYHELFKKVKTQGICGCRDFKYILNTRKYAPNFGFSNRVKKFFYIDPPYYQKGPQLYQCSFSDEDHIRLRNILKESQHPWLLSYDDCGRIKELYNWANYIEIDNTCTINGPNKKKELLITSKKYKELLEPLEKDIFEIL